MASIRITELKRLGGGNTEVTPVVFEWTSASHAMIDGATMDYELKINTVRELDPVSEEVVEQVMGAEWLPFEMRGDWLDKWAGKGFAENTEREFARMVGRTPLVRVQVDKRSFVGLITSLKIRYRVAGEIGYAFTLSVHKNENVGSFRQVPVSTPAVSSAETRLAEQHELLAGLETYQAWAVDNVPVKADGIAGTTDQLGQMADELARANAANASIVQDSDDGGDPTSLFTTVDRTQQRLLALAACFGRLASVSDELALTVRSYAAVDYLAYEDVVGALSFEEWSRTTYTDAIRTAASARQSAADARARASLNPITVYVAKNGDTWFRIASKFYGTSAGWRTIFDANDVDGAPVAGARYIIPQRRP